MAKKKKDLSRREFVKQTLGVAAIGALSGCSIPQVMRKIAGTEDHDTFRGEYDYIVVGSGAGGGPVACNLARAGFTVLLLEAGGNNPTRNYDVPSFQGNATEDPDLSWSFFVKHYSDLAQQKRDWKYSEPDQGILYPRAGTLGGCTAHNAMITLYPDNADWDNIVKITGDTTWNSDKMRDYFERVENKGYARPFFGNRDRRGLNGWLHTAQPDPRLLLSLGKDPVLRRMIEGAAAEKGGFAAAMRLGTKFLERNAHFDPNNWRYVNNKTDGIFSIPMATYRGKRNGTREYIIETLNTHPRNLFLSMNSLASEIIINEQQGKRATGVRYMVGARLYRADMRPDENAKAVNCYAKAKREVILAGGAFNSPQLLMLSGIGPKDELNKHGITPRHELEGVGKNLQDRYEVGVTTKLKIDIGSLKNCTFGKAGDPCLAEFDRNPASIYSSNGVIIALIKKSSPDKPAPDLAIFGTPGKFMGYVPKWSSAAAQKDHYTWAVLKGHTRNTAGTVTLKSNDPRDTPEINFRYFDEGNDLSGDDLRGLLEGVKTARQLNVNVNAISNSIPGRILSQPFIVGEDCPNVQGDDLTRYVKDNAWGHHASCTNKMGHLEDPMAVVDSKFKVRGIEGLRIVDASVFPKTPGLFIVLPIYMIAEKASAEIIAAARG